MKPQPMITLRFACLLALVLAAGQAVFGPAIAARMMNFFQGLNTVPNIGGAALPFLNSPNASEKC